MESIDFGLLALRLIVGGVFVGHALIKFTERFGGLGVERAGAVFEKIGFRPPRRYLVVAGVTELGAGVGILVGLATPLAGAALIGVMVNTIGSSKAGHGPWYFNGGWEYDLTLLVTAVALAFTGPGYASIDTAIGLDTGGWAWGIGAVMLGLLSGQAVLATRRHIARDVLANGEAA